MTIIASVKVREARRTVVSRAIGAQMVDRQAGQPGCISYASFVGQHERSFRR